MPNCRDLPRTPALRPASHVSLSPVLRSSSLAVRRVPLSPEDDHTGKSRDLPERTRPPPTARAGDRSSRAHAPLLPSPVSASANTVPVPTKPATNDNKRRHRIDEPAVDPVTERNICKTSPRALSSAELPSPLPASSSQLSELDMPVEEKKRKFRVEELLTDDRNNRRRLELVTALVLVFSTKDPKGRANTGELTSREKETVRRRSRLNQPPSPSPLPPPPSRNRERPNHQVGQDQPAMERRLLSVPGPPARHQRNVTYDQPVVDSRRARASGDRNHIKLPLTDEMQTIRSRSQLNPPSSPPPLPLPPPPNRDRPKRHLGQDQAAVGSSGPAVSPPLTRERFRRTLGQDQPAVHILLLFSSAVQSDNSPRTGDDQQPIRSRLPRPVPPPPLLHLTPFGLGATSGSISRPSVAGFIFIGLSVPFS